VEPYSPLNPGASYEMGGLNGGAPAAADDNQAFFDEIGSINEGIESLNANIAKIEALHQRSLADIDEYNSQQTQRQLESISAETSSLNAGLVRRIRTLKSKHAGKQQVGVVERKFKESLNKYRQVEKAFADSAREQMTRQYRIVQPDATEEEVRAACEDNQGQQIFSNAVRSPRCSWKARV
jgi:syntaxin 1B/2/3